ncbi:unnamed protein product [Gongylonema pulchrum]|uniref:Small ribosomal subunit protein uS5 n=1 Tax=Gongylonema pulchrum TaxID=637853 RepID=A0A183E6D0_9BILA|nr:unnamed protein product [Gongylonema pulchrum]
MLKGGANSNSWCDCCCKIVNNSGVILKVTGKCGSVTVRLIPAPRGTGIVSAPVPKKLLQMAGVEDCYTSACGRTSKLGNFAKATYAAILRTYCYLTPDLWEHQKVEKTPFQLYSDYILHGLPRHGETLIEPL